MGRSTTQELIAKGKNENKYNNSGITSDGTWVDFFNDALADLVDDVGLTDTFTIDFDPAVSEREYDLPSDFYGMFLLTDSRDSQVACRRNYNAQGGYWILNKGDALVIDLWKYTSPQTFKGVYFKYPAKLTGATGEFPQVPSVGERALIYYALSKALRNNAQTGDAAEMEAKYEEERKKIRTAAAKARG